MQHSKLLKIAALTSGVIALGALAGCGGYCDYGDCSGGYYGGGGSYDGHYDRDRHHGDDDDH